MFEEREKGNDTTRLDEKEKKLILLMRETGFGEFRVIIQDGKPIRIEEWKKSVKL